MGPPGGLLGKKFKRGFAVLWQKPLFTGFMGAPCNWSKSTICFGVLQRNIIQFVFGHARGIRVDKNIATAKIKPDSGIVRDEKIMVQH